MNGRPELTFKVEGAEYCRGFDAALILARRNHEERMAAVTTAIEFRIQQLASRRRHGRVAIELDWVLKLLGDIES
tara:strand:- start:526 stop:750 length:225 start_codon:yes stop_codon:yes gene_type:complete